MKLKTAFGAFAILFFLTARAEAQLYPGYPYLQVYDLGATTQPYYPQAYYPVPFGLPNYSLQDPLAARQAAVSNEYTIPSSNETTDTLIRQIEQLTEQVRSLQAEIAATDEKLGQVRVSETPQAPTKASVPAIDTIQPLRIIVKLLSIDESGTAIPMLSRRASLRHVW